MRVGLDEEPELKIARFLKGYLLALLTRWIYNITYLLIMRDT